MAVVVPDTQAGSLRLLSSGCVVKQWQVSSGCVVKQWQVSSGCVVKQRQVSSGCVVKQWLLSSGCNLLRPDTGLFYEKFTKRRFFLHIS